MPMYEYKCKNENCNHEFDKIMKFNDPNPECPICKMETEKKISKTNFQLTGNGFYATDYKSKS